MQIERLYKDGCSCDEIAEVMGRHPHTIENEIVRGWTGSTMADGQLEYSAELADLRCER